MKIFANYMQIWSLLLVKLLVIFASSAYAENARHNFVKLNKMGALSDQMLSKMSALSKGAGLEIKGDRKSNLQFEDNLKKFLENEKSQLQEKRGGIDTGGGTVVTTADGRHGLIDFFTHAPELFGKPEYRPRLRVPRAKNLKTWFRGIYKIDLKSLGAWAVLSDKITAWQKSSPQMFRYLESALNNIPIYFVNYEIKLVDRTYFIPENLKNEIVSWNTVAQYRRDWGLFISKPEFEKLPYDDQIGLLMKEILRHVQITYNANLSSEEMQILNVAMIKGPQGEETLDSVKFLPSKTIARLYDEASVDLLLANLAEDICEYSSRKQSDLCLEDLKGKTIKVLIQNLNTRLSKERDPEIENDLRAFRRRAFGIWERNIEIILKYDGETEYADKFRAYSNEKLNLEP